MSKSSQTSFVIHNKYFYMISIICSRTSELIKRNYTAERPTHYKAFPLITRSESEADPIL